MQSTYTISFADPHPIHTTGPAERIDIKHRLLSNKIDRKDFADLAAYFDNVEIYSLALGLTLPERGDMRRLQVLYGTQKAMMQCLSLWQSRQRSNSAAATYRTLIKVLQKIRRHEIASKVYKHCLENSKLT